MAESAGERNQAPSQKRLDDARKKGDILQSRELVTALGVAAGVAWLALAGPLLVDALAIMLTRGLAFDHADITDFAPQLALTTLLGGVALPLGALFAAALVAGIAAPALLGSLGWRAKGYAPQAQRLSPAAGLKRMFGLQGLTDLVRSLLKLGLLGSIAIAWIWRQRDALLGLGTSAMPPLDQMGALLLSLALWMLAGLVLIALIDVPVQYARRMAKLRMTRQELRDEAKESDGSPERKAAIRQRQIALMSRAVQRDIASAAVVVTNPEHFAVALRYDSGRDAAPVIVARGHDDLALAIREAAAAANVPVLAAPPLARAIFYTGQVGDVIDARLFAAVATVLALIFRLDRVAAQRARFPDLPIPADCLFAPDGTLVDAPAT